jgi:predicted nucleic acid-binding protein
MLRDGEGHAAEMAQGLLREGKAYIAGPIATELIRGSRGAKELSALEELFSLVGWFELTNTTYKQAGRIGNAMARTGQTLATIDLVLAQIAIENHVPILTLDKHFAIIAEHFSLTVVHLK